MKRALKVVATNVGVLILVVGVLNLLAVTITSVHSAWFGFDDDRFELPNYQDPAAAEVVFREFRSLESTYRPFVAWRRAPFAGQATTIGPDGRRVHPADPKDTADARTVAFFGGSVLWGTGSTDAETIPALVDHRLPGWKAVNHGETGYNSRQNLEAFIDAVNVGAPMDRVVFYEGGAGVPNGCKRTSSPNTHGQEGLMRQQLDRSGWTKLVAPTLEFVQRLFRPSKSAGEDPYNLYVCDDDPERARQVATVIWRNFRHAKAIADAAGVPFDLVLAPVAYFGKPRTGHLTLDPVRGAQFRAVYPILRALIREAGASWVHDLADAYDGDTYIYLDHCHVSPAGNQRMAERIAGLLAGGTP